MHVFGVLLLLTFLSSCGKSNSSAGIPVAEDDVKFLPVNGSNIQGLYMAKFITLNGHVNGSIPGSATLQRQEDKFYAYVRLFGGGPNVWHQQNIYEGNRCPGPQDDLNGDGYIDIEEGNKVWGKILIPLDANIGTQKAGKNVYPMADASGSYFYERVTSFERMFNDLKSEDKNSNDPFAKIAEGTGFDPVRKVVVVQGTADTVAYPETVASNDRRPPHQTLPIVCGVFEKVTSIPGEEENGEIPGPVGPVEEAPPVPEDGDISVPVPEPVPAPEPIPAPREEEEERTPRRPRDYGEEQEDPWYDRVIDWWRDTWERERAGRRQNWGNGIWRLLN